MTVIFDMKSYRINRIISLWKTDTVLPLLNSWVTGIRLQRAPLYHRFYSD